MASAAPSLSCFTSAPAWHVLLMLLCDMLRERLLRESAGLAALLRSASAFAASLLRLALKREQDAAVAAAGRVAGA